jgi:Nanos RNA binding domain
MSSSINKSSNNKYNKTNAYVARVPCCKVCKDAGEPENIYSSHYVKDREGNVTCPKLKTIVCLNCGKSGHTSSYCKVPIAKPVIKAEAKKLVEPVAAKSRFACLFEDEDSDDEKVVARKPAKSVIPSAKLLPEKANNASTVNVSNVFDFPSLSAADTKPTNSTEKKPFSYASMAAKPVESKVVRQVIAVPKYVRPESPTIEPPRQYKKASEMDWAMEDSDSDDEF